ncbi:MAG: hypothetical protein FWE35_22550 [Streptosporangiales bacterium]|nr:hypothetical protein [Streptosporangiales bacterium]
MAAVISEGIVEGAARTGAFAAGRALLRAGAVAELESFDGGAGGLVTDRGAERDVWVGIRYRFLVGECDCADAKPEATSDEYLQAAADGEADPPELCAHAVAVALAAVEDGLPWASAPLDHRPLYLRTAGLRVTTPAPPFDITTVFPELAGLAATTIRLHPRPGRPGTEDSSFGGPLLWPADQEWPVCGLPHPGTEPVPVPPDARPLLAVLQVYARDVPELPFPDGTDLFQLLWCPNAHDEPWYGPAAETFWRRAADVGDVLADPPAPVFDSSLDEDDFNPVPCLVHPERVIEYPDAGDLPRDLRDRVQEWDRVLEDDAPHLYWSSLSVAPGSKLLGHPRWYQEPRWPVCGCGRRMRHLVTISSEEFGARRWRPDDDGEEPPSAFARNFAPHGIMIGDVGDMYLFTCESCPGRPLAVETQSG